MRQTTVNSNSGGPGSFERWHEDFTTEAMVPTTDSTIIILTGRVQILPVVTIPDTGYLDPLLRLDNCHMCHSAQVSL